MAGATGRKISAAAARAHTRKSKPSSFRLPSGIFQKLLLVSSIGILAWAYQAIQPPQTKIPGSPGGPSVTAPRIKLRDGRHLAYKEHGAPKDAAKFKIVYVHCFDSCRHDAVVENIFPQKIIDDLGVYVVSFDRPGYGQSDPDPKRTTKSIALDIEELADQLGLGSKFYVVGYSIGGQIVWSCIKYIPHRYNHSNEFIRVGAYRNSYCEECGIKYMRLIQHTLCENIHWPVLLVFESGNQV